MTVVVIKAQAGIIIVVVIILFSNNKTLEKNHIRIIDIHLMMKTMRVIITISNNDSE